MNAAPVLQEWARSHGMELQPRERDGRIACDVDDRYRLYLYPMPEGRLLVEARVIDLPLEGDARERLVFEALHNATGRIRDQRERLVADAAGTMLSLQLEIPTDEGVEALNDALGDFLNHLAAWRVQLQS